ncbi:MAG: hypothetical protein H6837_10965 [Planctomycetes bacterium]|nr:hypothetical protein [Planctomycetota bacterium]
MNRPTLLCSVLAVCLSPLAVLAQGKRPLNHDDYDRWPSIRGAALSPDGRWVAYSVDPAWGDGVLHVQEIDGTKTFEHARGSQPQFSADSRSIVFVEKKSVVAERAKQLAELRAGKKPSAAAGATETRGVPTMPRRGPGGVPIGRPGADRDAVLLVLDLGSGKVETLGKARGHRVVRRGEYLLFHRPLPESAKREGAAAPANAPERTGRRGGRAGARRGGRARRGAAAPGTGRLAAPTPGAAARGPGDRPAAGKSVGTDLVVRQFATGQQRTFADVVSFRTTAEDRWLLLTRTGKRAGLSAVPLAGGDEITLLAGDATISAPVTDPHYRVLAFTSDAVDKAAAAARKKPVEAAASLPVGASTPRRRKKPEEPKIYHDIYLWEFSAAAAQRIVSRTTPGIPAGHHIEPGNLAFSRDGGVLSFEVRQPPQPESPPILPSERVVLDIWHWNDGLIQPQQARNRARDDRRTCVLHRKGGSLVVLGDEAAPTARLLARDGSTALVSSGKRYEKMISYDGRYADYSIVDTRTGVRTRLLTKSRTGVLHHPLVAT